jgi:hypothetical protein
MSTPTRPRRRHRHVATAVGVAFGVALVAGPLGAPAGAATDDLRQGPARPAFTLNGTGTWQIREWINDVVVNGTGELSEHDGRRTRDVQVAAVIQTDDRTLPAAGECERAFATMSAYGVRNVDLTLVGMGTVCGTHVQPPTSIVSHVFTGRFEVYGESTTPRRLEGVDGFYQIRLAVDGAASVFAIDT